MFFGQVAIHDALSAMDIVAIIALLPILTGAREPARRHGAVIMACNNVVGHVLTVLHSNSVRREARLH